MNGQFFPPVMLPIYFVDFPYFTFRLSTRPIQVHCCVVGLTAPSCGECPSPRPPPRQRMQVDIRHRVTGGGWRGRTAPRFSARCERHRGRIYINHFVNFQKLLPLPTPATQPDEMHQGSSAEAGGSSGERRPTLPRGHLESRRVIGTRDAPAVLPLDFPGQPQVFAQDGRALFRLGIRWMVNPDFPQ